MISSIILSAGESHRFGSPKALAHIKDRINIEHMQDKLLEAGTDEIIIVLGADAHLIEPHVFNHKKVRIVYNKNYKLGQTSSFQAGVSSVADNSSGILMMPVDCPFVTANTLKLLISTFTQQLPDILLPVFNGKRGHPPIFNSSLKSNILNLPTDSGVNLIFNKFPAKTIEIFTPNILHNFNTPEELKFLLKKEKDAV